MAINVKPKAHWFWAWTVLMTIQKAKKDNPRARVEIWLNLVLIRARDGREAIQKAYQLGKREAGDSQGSLRLNGKPAVTKFLGIQDIGLVHDEIADGSEILWRLKTCNLRTARKLSKRSIELRKNLERELAQSQS
jgi:hypothetical protein